MVNKEMQHQYEYEDDNSMSTREVLLYGMGSLLLLGGTFFIGRKLLRDAVKKNEENTSVDEDSVANYAKGIKMAFDNDGWWGTDEDALRSVLSKIPSKVVFEKVMKSYQRLYNKSLMAEMQSELNTSEYNEMLAIINSKTSPQKNGQVYLSNKQYEGWAKRLKSAFDKSYGFIPGTDEEAVRAVFAEIPTRKAFAQVSSAYQFLYNKNLLNDLKSELEFWEYEPMMKIIINKPQ
jgi:hypothetical protein